MLWSDCAHLLELGVLRVGGVVLLELLLAQMGDDARDVAVAQHVHRRADPVARCAFARFARFEGRG